MTQSEEIKLEHAWDSGCSEDDFKCLFGDDGVNFYNRTISSNGDNFRFIDAERKKWRKSEPTDPEYRKWLGLDGTGKQLRDIIKSVRK